MGNSQTLSTPSHYLNVSQLLRSSIHRQRRIQKMRMDGQRCLLITCLSPAWPETLMWKLPPFQLPSKKGHSAHAVHGALSWKTMKFCKFQLFESKIPRTLLLYARYWHFPRDMVLPVKSGPAPPSWPRTSLCFAFYFGLHPLLSCLVLLIHVCTYSLHIYMLMLQIRMVSHMHSSNMHYFEYFFTT